MIRYRIYRNLHSQTWTVQHKIKGKGWRKLNGYDAIYVPQVEFKVYASGRDRARREGRKNVHAFALTDEYWPVDAEAAGNIWDACRYGVRYSPFDDRGFTTVDGGGRNLTGAAACIFAPWGAIGVDHYSQPVPKFYPDSQGERARAAYYQPKLEKALGVMRIELPALTS